MQVDIIGGGISGLSAAIALKQNKRNIDVIVHEKYSNIGFNHEGRRCGEAHSVEREWGHWQPTKEDFFNKITSADVYIGSKYYHVHRRSGTSYILNRQAFIARLGKKAEELDVRIQTHDKVSTLTELQSDFIIDGSGCPSSIKRELGFDKGLKGVTYQHTIENCNVFNSKKVEIHYIKKFGYFWVFPRNPEKKEVNLGVGFILDFGYDIKKMLEEFKQKQGITGKVNYVSGGLIPIGMQPPFKYKNILFVGDASVGTFPFSGQGIYRALLSGDAAGKLIALGQEKKYPFIIKQMFIKWDIIGKTFIRVNLVLRRINEQCVIYNLNKFISIDKVLHI